MLKYGYTNDIQQTLCKTLVVLCSVLYLTVMSCHLSPIINSCQIELS